MTIAEFAEGFIVHDYSITNFFIFGRSLLFARNAIDGVFATLSHGVYPYQSWGINRQEDAALTIDFG
ncbi:hypothetical protein Hs30E_15130 [Lactococcus hodotermopsidis]|uniref:Uncharacterized protein n=1 Tax=Pseudolactococcus hodotermopsidis TaxID=2709157 RepID=A0A6A0BC78_9LACT|nr:hypothetical protein Hs30E_15130 [Lactococcus hodotermopsidis]